jgi:Holliday junction resolvase RusA-like endonuclease
MVLRHPAKQNLPPVGAQPARDSLHTVRKDASASPVNAFFHPMKPAKLEPAPLTTAISFFVSGDPVAQPRIKAYGRKGVNRATGRERIFTKVYTPGKLIKPWKAVVTGIASLKRPKVRITGPVRVDTIFYFRRPRDHYGTGRNAGILKSWAPLYHTTVPDRDNLDKACLDVLTKCRFWGDDCQAALGLVGKVYANDDEQTGVRITITPLPATYAEARAAEEPKEPK